jgi:hypothetical protein
MKGGALYGVLAEFATADLLLAATRAARRAGYRLEAYAPYPVEGLAEAVGFGPTRMPLVTFAGGLAGGLGTYFMEWYSAVISYPINVGGRPLHSWPAFVPPAVAFTILGAALASVLGMILANGLPRLRHPLFEVPGFDLATRNRFFLCLCVPAGPEGMDAGRAESLLQAQRAMKTWRVPRG